MTDHAVGLMAPVHFWNVSFRKVGGLHFLKIGRFCVSFCVTAEYRSL
jgi:hypothetical protein